MPIGVTSPSGDMSVMLSPSTRPRLLAMRWPMATPWDWSKPASEPCLMLLETTESLPRSSPLMPRTSAPDPAPTEPEASTCPSISGIAYFTPATPLMRWATAS
jgi:hypothetical protein